MIYLKQCLARAILITFAIGLFALIAGPNGFMEAVAFFASLAVLVFSFVWAIDNI